MEHSDAFEVIRSFWNEMLKACTGKRGGRPRIKNVSQWLLMKDLEERWRETKTKAPTP